MFSEASVSHSVHRGRGGVMMSLLVWSHVPSRRSMMSLPVWSHVRTSFRRGVCGLRRGSLLPDGHYNGWYASYWNAFLFLYKDCRAISIEEIVLLPHFYFNLGVLGKRVQGHVGIPRMTVGLHVPIELVLGSPILYLYALSCLLMHFTPTHTHYLLPFVPACALLTSLHSLWPLMPLSCHLFTVYFMSVSRSTCTFS